MSTRDRLSIPPLLRIPEAWRAPVEGVSLAAYLVVEASRLDGLPLPAVLAWLGLRESVFDRVEERWSDRIADELARDGAGTDALYQELLSHALSLWGRRTAPLDAEIEAWMTFQRHALAAADPGELARGLGLTAGDELRLAWLWQHRLLDPAIAARAAEAWSAPIAPLPRLALSPLVFPPAVEPP
ncbi:MAG: hypothetical protein ABJE95_34390 [Byssovorax sp.]